MAVALLVSVDKAGPLAVVVSVAAGLAVPAAGVPAVDSGAGDAAVPEGVQGNAAKWQARSLATDGGGNNRFAARRRSLCRIRR